MVCPREKPGGIVKEEQHITVELNLWVLTTLMVIGTESAGEHGNKWIVAEYWELTRQTKCVWQWSWAICCNIARAVKEFLDLRH